MRVDEVPEGTMKMCFVDGTDQVIVVNTNGDFHALQGICSHEYFELDKGFLTNGTLAPVRCTSRASTSRTASRWTRRPRSRSRSIRW